MKKKISDYTTAIYCCRFAINNLLCVEYIKKYRPKKKELIAYQEQNRCCKNAAFHLSSVRLIHLPSSTSPRKSTTSAKFYMSVFAYMFNRQSIPTPKILFAIRMKF